MSARREIEMRVRKIGGSECCPIQESAPKPLPERAMIAPSNDRYLSCLHGMVAYRKGDLFVTCYFDTNPAGVIAVPSYTFEDEPPVDAIASYARDRIERRWQIILDPGLRRWSRRPRSRKRRIRRKWMADPRNWSPSMTVLGVGVLFGCGALMRAGSGERSPYHNEEDPTRPRILRMHPLAWEECRKTCDQSFLDPCDVVED